MANRCEKHKIFMGKDGCKICNEISSAQVKLEASNRLIEHHRFIRNELHKDCNDLVEKVELFEQANKELTEENNRLNIELNSFNNELSFENDKLRAEWKRDREYIETLEIKLEKAQSKELSPELKHAISYLSRNEKPIFINLFAAESVIASCWDLYKQIPEKRQETIKPFIEKIMGFCEVLNEFNTELAIKATKAMGVAEYNNMIIEAIRVLDTASGKVENCHTCLHALDRKAFIRKELKKGKA